MSRSRGAGWRGCRCVGGCRCVQRYGLAIRIGNHRAYRRLTAGRGRIHHRTRHIAGHDRIAGAAHRIITRHQRRRPQGDVTQLVICQGDITQRHISCVFDRVVVRDGIADVGGGLVRLFCNLNRGMALECHGGFGAVRHGVSYW